MSGSGEIPKVTIPHSERLKRGVRIDGYLDADSPEAAELALLEAEGNTRIGAVRVALLAMRMGRELDAAAAAGSEPDPETP